LALLTFEKDLKNLTLSMNYDAVFQAFKKMKTRRLLF